MSTPIFNNILRKVTVGFGNLFNTLYLVRYNLDGTEAQRILVPIEFASKEKYVSRLQGDPNLDRKVQVTLPAMSFEMMGLNYDASRKQITNVKNFSASNGTLSSQYKPVPYDLDYNLYLYVRNEEDGTQLIEKIVPFFTPDYTIKVNTVPSMGIVDDVPIILNSITYDNQFEGGFDTDTRTIIWTLNFTVKAFIYGNQSLSGFINHTITNVYNNIDVNDSFAFTLSSGVGQYQLGEIAYQGYSQGTATATAIVVDINSINNQITLKNINGNFISTLPIKGSTSGASHNYSVTNLVPRKDARIDIVPNPITANINTPWTANTTITEYK